MRNWVLPEYVEDILPAEAAKVEKLRREILDLFKLHGYSYVIPPMLEYLESLITGVGHDLDLATFKVVDQLNGRLMGVRADTTPQAARIDAHMINNQGITRLCYAGSVLRTNPDGLAKTREPIQIGAELFGHNGVESDIEIQCLMVEALKVAGLDSLHVDFSHVGIFKYLVEDATLNQQEEYRLYQALQTKDQSEVLQVLKNSNANVTKALLSLTELNGDISILDKAETLLPSNSDISNAISQLRQVGMQLLKMDVDVCFDLSELRGYHYHSGIVFAAYAQGFSGPLALGGRYDEVGLAFGRARPATGFSLDLRGLIRSLKDSEIKKSILAPYGFDTDLMQIISRLRSKGEIVIQDLPGQSEFRSELNCDRSLVKKEGNWIIEII